MKKGDKIKLLMDLPINKQCGASKGEVFKISGFKMDKLKSHRLILVYFKGKNGDKCGAYPYEFELINEAL